jgi:hypothetical protein
MRSLAATMTSKTLTKGPTEADLEAEIHAALRKTFPWLPVGALRHQLRFSFTIGRATIEIDGTATTAEGRTDILVYAHAKPLAVFELKRRGLALTLDDEAQGLSYAKVLTPSFPLVVVTNGDETRILAAYSGEAWEPDTPSEGEFAKLLAAAGRAATADVKQAVSTLMGSSPAVWMQAVRAASQAHIEEMSGEWDNPLFPFVRGFLFPRKAVMAADRFLREGHRLLLIEGAPLAGKSSALRELVLRTLKTMDMAVLFVAADEGRGITQCIADLLASALSWPVTADEARHWLRQLSHASGPALVLAVDGVGPDHDAIRRELEDFSSGTFGPQLRLVVTADDAVAKRLIEHPNGRQMSALGRRVDCRIAFGLLDDDEFKQAANALWDRRMGLQHGASSALEMRVPWILRALGGRYAPGPDDPPDRAVVLPAQLSLDLIGHARARFADDELRRQFGEIAQAVLNDAEDASLPLALKLEAMATFVVRRATLLRYLDRAEIEGLLLRGLIKPAIHESREPVLFVRLPELLASEASLVLGKALMEKAQADAEEGGRWLVSVTSRIPLGDIIAACAFADAVEGTRGVPLGVVHALAGRPPTWKPITPGMRAVMHVPDVGMMEVTFEKDGSFTAEINGKRQRIEADSDEPPGMIGDYHPWLILSHLAGQRIVYGTDATRLDLELLGLVGSCEHVLRRPDRFLEGGGIPTHDVAGYGEVVCHAAGIVEPITFSLFKMLSREGPDQDAWIERALAQESLGLLARIDIALRETAKLLDPVKRPWAERILRDRIAPALGEALTCAS